MLPVDDSTQSLGLRNQEQTYTGGGSKVSWQLGLLKMVQPAARGPVGFSVKNKKKRMNRSDSKD